MFSTVPITNIGLLVNLFVIVELSSMSALWSVVVSESDDSKIRAQAQPVKVILKDVKGAAHLKPALTLLTTPTLGRSIPLNSDQR